MKKIMVWLKNYGILIIDSLEIMYNKYVIAILYIAINIARDAIDKDFSMRPECKIIGDKSFRKVDYIIKKAKNFISIMKAGY